MKIDLTGVQETLLLPLWGRAKLSREDNPVLQDSKAIEIVDKIIEYDFDALDSPLSQYTNISWLVRARMFDDTIRSFAAEHPRGTIVNLGAGFDTTFFRVDNGSMKWYDIDLPDVIEIRRTIMPPPNDRVDYIAGSLLDTSWMGDFESIQDGILFFAGGVLYYFEETEIRALLSRLASVFPEGEIVFDTLSTHSVPYVNKTLENAGIGSALIKWGIDNTEAITTWDSRLTILEDYPMYSRIENRDYWGKEIASIMDSNDKYKNSCIVHLKFQV